MSAVSVLSTDWDKTVSSPYKDMMSLSESHTHTHTHTPVTHRHIFVMSKCLLNRHFLFICATNYCKSFIVTYTIDIYSSHNLRRRTTVWYITNRISQVRNRRTAKTCWSDLTKMGEISYCFCFIAFNNLCNLIPNSLTLAVMTNTVFRIIMSSGPVHRHFQPAGGSGKSFVLLH